MDIYFNEKYSQLYETKNEVTNIFNFNCEYGDVKYLYLKRKIELLNGEYYDIITPYGYGGPIFEPKKNEYKKKLIDSFYKKFEKYCQENNIISEFIRFHPLIKNNEELEFKLDVSSNSSTVFIDLLNEKTILENMTSKCRNMFRKAIKNNVIVKEDEELETLDQFKKIYFETMDKNNANDNYYFSNNYFKKISRLTGLKIFNAYLNDEIIATTMILLGDDYIHYHLSANTPIGYQTAANNLLLFEISKWGHKNNFKYFNLGGGFGGDDSSLFKFKKSFNKNGILKFYIGKKIYNRNIYDLLVEELEEKNKELKGKKSIFFPLYRRG